MNYNYVFGTILLLLGAILVYCLCGLGLSIKCGLACVGAETYRLPWNLQCECGSRDVPLPPLRWRAP
jgi:hypothetical protein